jgi:two-component system response regulator
MANHTVLVVEDSEMEALMLERGLRQAIPRTTIVHCATTTEAEDYLFASLTTDTRSRQNPDLVVLDVRVPPAGGMNLLLRLRSDARTRGIPVVMMSSHMGDDDVNRLYHGGANSYLDKPVDFNEYVALIANAARYWLGLNMNPKLTR